MNPLQRVVDIIQTQMGLASDQVYIYNQRFTIPNDTRLYIAVAQGTLKTFGGKIVYVDNGMGGLNEVSTVKIFCPLAIDVMSVGTDALFRKEEVLLALASTYSKKWQQTEGFSIARLSTNFVNLSVLETVAIPYRFNIGINLQYEVSKTTAVDYYDSAPVPQVTTEE